MEIRTGSPAVVHHIIVNVCEVDVREVSVREPTPALYWNGVAKLIEAGSDLVFQMHHTPNGEATTGKSYYRPVLFQRAGAGDRAYGGRQ